MSQNYVLMKVQTDSGGNFKFYLKSTPKKIQSNQE